MSLMDFLFGSKAVLYDQATREKVELGVMISETQTRSVELTAYPIETSSGTAGAVSDHVQRAPDTFSVEVVLNDIHPASVESLTGLIFGRKKSVEEKIEQLDWWMREGILLVYSGPQMSKFIERVYQITSDNLVITDFEVSRSVDDGTAIKASLSFSKVTIVKAMMTDIKLPAAAQPMMQKGTGTTGAEEVTAPASSGDGAEWFMGWG